MTNTLPNGFILQNEYKIIGVLGQGGFGITYLAEDINLKYKVVIKEFLPQDMAARDETRISIKPFTKDTKSYEHLLKRFSEEAQLLAKMHHPNIVKVIRFFKANNTAYFVMEYAEGQTLKDYLKTHKTLNEEEILSIMMPILEGAKYVHSQGFLHRDIAPDNIYLTKNGMPILIDFGAARDAIAEESKNISSIVKEGYSAPEQYTVNNQQNASADIYALGAVFYRLITGKVPVNAPHRQTALLNDEPDPIGDIAKEYSGKYSQTLLHAVKKALNIRASDRFDSVAEFQKALLGDTVVDSTPSPISRHRASTVEQPSQKNSGNTGLIVALVVVFFILMGVIGYLFMNKQESPLSPSVQGTTTPVVVESVHKDELAKAKQEIEELKRKQAEEAAKRQKASELEKIRKEREEIERQKREQLAELERLKREKEEAERRRRAAEEEARRKAAMVPKTKSMDFSENGIAIHVTYPSVVRAGERFTITASMTNNYARAKQGGLTLSFPDINALPGRLLHHNFAMTKGYAYPEKIYSQTLRKAIPAKYFMVEGWHDRPWAYGATKSFSVELEAPYRLSELRVNLRGILWIRNKHDTRKIPSYSPIYDQQGFPVKQFSIQIR